MKNMLHAYSSRQHMLGENYEIYHYLDQRMHGVELHHHDFYEVYLLVSGDLDFLIEGQTYRLNPGDIVLLDTRDLHQAYIRKTDTPYERYVFWISRSYLRSLSSDKTDLLQCFEAPEKRSVVNTDFEIRQELKMLFQKLIALEDFQGEGKDLLAKAYSMEILVKIRNILADKEKLYNTILKKSVLIDSMIAHIEANLSEDLTIDRLAEEFFLSKYHLSREFKKYTGVTIHRYIILKRLIMAKEFILQNDSITDVYIKCGFGDYSNFFRAFKKEYGITPKQFYEIMTDAERAL
ncbi:AraC family transcriptional regulator [Anaerotalea alkaliphila]|uniref:AraC family transcriptional regulator n=1 Tax=Anaerotalea alkaliphila TaxID=2662126 RepID=A0A7X5HUL9_9FIRM|nr:AraC family transcriptional regulator [Anaerotalea alkaliphila]NDL66943.1 AraC family transcriptional regulator [Anaerotalea alkaliphila]